jgi:membrane-bound lytic murein transglycosylase D
MVKKFRQARREKRSRYWELPLALLLFFFWGWVPAARAQLDESDDLGSGNGMDYSFMTPPPLSDVHVYDKSMPMPEVIRKLHEPSGYILDEEMEAGPFQLPLNEYVQSYIDYFCGRAHNDFSRWMRRSGLYREIIVSELRKRQMPEELLYLCMIESGFNPRAASWAGAKGLWQFIRSTGQNYGLKSDFWVEERYDPEKSTNAALDYLGDLYTMFGDWHLAAAAYNTGEGNVMGAMRRTGCNDYWGLNDQNALHRETRDYLPKMIAAAIISRHPERHGFYGVERLPALRYATVTIDGAVDLRVAARCAGVSVAEIERLNPEIIQYCTPPGVKNYHLHIPPTQVGEFRTAYAALRPEDKIAFKRHTVAKGETIRAIAAGYGTSSKMLAAMNSRSLDAGLNEGQELIVPVPPDRPYDPSRRAQENTEPRARSQSGSSRKKSLYVLEPGDTLWAVARMTGVSVEDLKRWNNIKDPTTLQDGDTIVLFSPRASSRAPTTKHKGKTKTISYTVRPGDSCYYLARHYGIQTRDIIAQNHLGSGCSLKPGQRLTLTVPKQAPSTAPPTVRESSPAAPVAAGRSKVTHTVKKGETLSAIAKKYRVSAADIKKWNNLKSNALKPGQKLYIRTAAGVSAGASCPAPPKGKKVTYAVKPGESLWTIARNHDVRVADIMAWNGLTSDGVKPGRKLVIYPGASAGAAAPPPKSSTAAPPKTPPKSSATPPKSTHPSGSTIGKKKITYTVKNGDSLWGIAREHNVHAAEIKQWNHLAGDTVKPGQKLVIYVDK